MEIKNERVLAYQLATELKEDEIEEISGGDGALNPAMKSTRWTGQVHSADVAVDW